ncbi:hypothetical protein Efla_003011 [Eimeria flavescens]
MQLFSSLAAAALLLALAGGVAGVRSPKKLQLQGLDEEAKALHVELQMQAGEFALRIEKNELAGLYMRHVNGVQQFAVPPHKGKEERKEYEKRMKLMIGVMTVACKRLQELAALEHYRRETLAKVPLLSKEDLNPLPPSAQLARDPGEVVLSEELVKMIPRGVCPVNAREADNQLLPRLIRQAA